MAYRFNGSNIVRFAPAPLVGHAFPAGTFAIFLKRGVTSITHFVVALNDSGDGQHIVYYIHSSDTLRLLIGANATGPGLGTSTTTWWLLVVTCTGSSARFHVHNGTSWSHTAGSGTLTAYTPTGTDKFTVGANTDGGVGFNGDIVCAGIKMTDSTDLQVETLSRTAFQAWRDFGFDWLIGFDTSLQSAGVLQDQASPGTGDQTGITGTSVVSDPPGWAWSSAVTPAADFTGTPLTGVRSLSVAFTDSSTNTPTSWAWTFGDGGTSTSQNPTHSYTTAGTYTVALVATNAAGSNTKTRTGYVTVANPSGTMTKIKWGDRLVATDEGGGVIRVDFV